MRRIENFFTRASRVGIVLRPVPEARLASTRGLIAERARP
jgi:hypothetical protein